jgi:hypothetical protein
LDFQKLDNEENVNVCNFAKIYSLEGKEGKFEAVSTFVFAKNCEDQELLDMWGVDSCSSSHGTNFTVMEVIWL